MAKDDTTRLGKVSKRDDGDYELFIFDFPKWELLQSRGWQGGGHSWGAIAEALLALHKGSPPIRFSCEGDTFVAISKNEADLVGLSELLGAASQNDQLLDEAIAWAEAEGQME